MYSQTLTRFIKQYKVNWIIKILIVSDFLIWSANQLFAPIFAIYITDNIANGTIEAVGFATAIYLIAKSIFQIPVGMYIDRTKSEKDDLYLAVFGTLLTGFVFLSYAFIGELWHLYILQAVLGISAAIGFPGWYSIFTKHIDKKRVAFEWSLYDVVLGLGMAGAAGSGGVLVATFGFSVVFVIAAISAVIGAFLLLLLQNRIK